MSFSPRFSMKISTNAGGDDDLKKGNFIIGVDEETDFGPTDVTGFWAVDEPTGTEFALYVSTNNIPTAQKFADETALIAHFEATDPSITTLDDVLAAVAADDTLCLVSAEPYDTSNDLDVSERAIAQTESANPQALGKLIRLRNKLSNTKKQNCFDWVAMTSYNGVEYGVIYSGTIIKEVESDGTINTLVSSTSTPTVGTINVVAGRIYTSNKPVHYLAQGDNHIMVPLSYKGRRLGTYGNRGFTATVRIFCLYNNTSIQVWRDKLKRDGTLLSTESGNRGDIITISLDSSNSSKPVFFLSNKKIVGSIQHGSSDRFILPVLSTDYIYSRYPTYEFNAAGVDPSLNSSYVVKDDKPTFTIGIADGSGSEAEAGIPLEFLTNTYGFGGRLRSYFIVSPYTNTITISYWNGSSWTQYASHTTNGTLTNPATDSEGLQTGGGAYLVDSTNRVWKFEGTNPFQLTINDGSSDEESMLGWDSEEEILSIAY